MQQLSFDVLALWPYFIVSMVGIMGHWLKTMVAFKQSGDVHITLARYLTDHIYQTGLSILTTLAGVVMLAEANQLTLAAAFLAGYAADSGTDLFGGKVQKVYG